MKTQISKPARERTSYTKEYKQEALSLWRESGRRGRYGVSLGLHCFFGQFGKGNLD